MNLRVICQSLIVCGLIHIVFGNSPCQDLKIKTKETVLDSPILKENPPLWLAPNYTTVFAWTSGKTLWRSSDSGVNWSPVVIEKTDRFRDVQLSSDKSSVVLVPENDHNIFTSTNGGKTWTKRVTPGKFGDFKFHPLKSQWILAQKIGCPENFNCSNDLYFSSDFGLSWMLLRTYVWRYDWHGQSIDDQLIIVFERNLKQGYQNNYPSDSQVVSSSVFFRNTPTVIAEDVLGFLTTPTHIFIAKAEISGGLSLLVSTDKGASFHDTRFPGGRIENRYTILDTSEGSTFVNVDHSNGIFSNWGNVYSSNSFDSDFTLSLEHNPRTIRGKCDFKRVQGIEGIYLANQYTRIGDDNNDVAKGKQTVISFDKGASWKRLPKPINHKGDCVKPEDCMLNLYGNSNNGEWYSRAEGIGLIMSTGVVGPYFNDDQSALSVYMSHDAGWTWEYITSGSYTYEIGNRGAILMMAHDNIWTRDIEYSVDQGKSWTTCGMLNETFDVDDIVSDPRMSSGIFLIYGSRNSKGVVVQVDFADVHERDCTGHESPDVETSDYESWEPTDSQGSKCLLGRRTKYVRRKPNAKCDNPVFLSTQDVKIVKNCSCTESDYQCDFCFNRVGSNCVFDMSYCGSYDPNKQPENCKGTWLKTSGYRKVVGDTCDPKTGVDHMPTVMTCNETKNGPVSSGSTGGSEVAPPPIKVDSNSSAVIGVLFFLAILALLAVFMWYLSGSNQTVRDLALKVFPEKFLPNFQVPGVAYSVLNPDDEDAPALNLDDDSLEEARSQPKTSDNDFDPRG